MEVKIVGLIYSDQTTRLRTPLYLTIQYSLRICTKVKLFQ